MTNQTLRVNFHCHSDLSDGHLTPEALAELLARSGVRVAALTDHDTVEGQARFQEALGRLGVGFVSGMEISATSPWGPLHLLAYGFNLAAPTLQEVVQKAQSEPGGGKLPVREAMDLLHQAGAKVFLAHPLVLEADLETLKLRLLALKELGLDGIEAIYAPYSQDQILALLRLARECELPVCAGSDYHGPLLQGLSDASINMPLEHWRPFRDLLLTSPGAPTRLPAELPPARRSGAHLDWKNFLLRILAPTLMAIVLLVVPLFAYVIPGFERALLTRKQEMIRELTNSAHSILQEYYTDEMAGRMTRREAQRAAISRIQYLRYGKEGKDYFWITDLQPRMVVHPYRPDLNGQDLSSFQDPKGNRIFVEFADLVRNRKEGYLDYVWQWKDDAFRLAPKQSYVRLFEPWGWVIGTGIYLDDVHAEISSLTGRVVQIIVVMALLIALLLIFIAQQSLRIERQRSRAEDALRDSHERYRVLVEASKEGTVMVMNGRCVYANKTFLSLLGYEEEHLPLLDMDEIILPSPGEPPISQWIAQYAQPGSEPSPLEARLRPRIGDPVDVLITMETMHTAERQGTILFLRDLSAHKEMRTALDASQARFRTVAENLKVGVFRAAMDRKMSILEANSAAIELLRLPNVEGTPEGSLAEAFGNSEALEAFRTQLLSGGESQNQILELDTEKGPIPVALSATLVRDERGEPKYCDAVAEDVTARQRDVSARDALIAELQTSLLYLGEPVLRYMQEPVCVDLQTPISETTILMARLNLGAVLVQAPGGEPVGILTDHDLRSRVLAAGVGTERPAYEVMSSPLVSLSSTAQGFEAIRLMRDRRIQHLVVKDGNGAVVGLISRKDLLHADRYPLAVLAHFVREAKRPEGVVEQRERLPMLVKALIDSGAKPSHTCRAITTVSDTVTEKFAAFAMANLGPAPAPFAFLALGSQGREEQTLFSDQDSALIFDPGSSADPGATQAYFLRMGEHISDWMEKAGYDVCRGGMMARNPRWCQPLAQWKDYFRGWIRLADPQNLMEFNTFSDFRCVLGETALAYSLRGHIYSELSGNPGFFTHLARTSLEFKPPVGFFGNIVPHGQKTINLKESLAPIVNFARLYALKHNIAETSTVDRLRRLNELGVLSKSGCEELTQAHDFLMSMRLRHQTDRIMAGLAPDNEFPLGTLTHIEVSSIKQVFTQISIIQKKASFDFLGGA